ncbi:MAG: formaldehyde-activating enzyme [Ilumatobacteraceae bacterium]|nr:formaldehyde-activating enzyme [Ilumatobacteraceae bacterium]
MKSEYGESFVGEGTNAAHINTVLGDREGAVGTAWATGLATPSVGHTRFVAVAAPNQPLQPMTLFVNKATIETEHHGDLTWGAAQRGVARGVQKARDNGVFGTNDLHDLALIVAVWVNPLADDAELVEENNAEATYLALKSGSYL